MVTKNRTELKSYFVKNAIPTESNFADLIDSQLNQEQDGVFKREGEPLSVVAPPGGAQRRALRLYSAFPSTNPDWMISLNPAQNPANPEATSNMGFGLTDGQGQTRLFVESGTGRLGVGTNTPQAQLDVVGAARVERLQVAGAIQPSVGNSFDRGLLFGGQGDDEKKAAFVRYFESGQGAEQKSELRVGNTMGDQDIVTLHQAGGNRVTIRGGNVGINNDSPTKALDVIGNTKISGIVDISGNVVASGALSLGGSFLVGSTTSHRDSTHHNGILYLFEDQLFMGLVNGFAIREIGDVRANEALMFNVKTGDLWVKGNYTKASDARLKRDIEPLHNALDKVRALRGVSYRRRDAQDEALHIGLVAQEVESVFPEVVRMDASGDRSIAYADLVAPLIEAVKELHAQVLELRAGAESVNTAPSAGS